MKQVHCLGFDWTENVYVFLLQGADILITSIEIAIKEPQLHTISTQIEAPVLVSQTHYVKKIK